MNRTTRLAQYLARPPKRLVAMLVHNLDNGQSRYVDFIAFREHLWVGSYRQIENASEEIIQVILDAHPRSQKIENYVSNHLDQDACAFVKDYIPDGLCGRFDRKTRQIHLDHGPSVPSSPLVKKVTETLRSRSVNQQYPDEKERTYKKNKIYGDWNWSQPVYHGTSTEHFQGIVRFGLKPMPHQTNYKEIVHDDAIFMTPIWAEAEAHAFHTAQGEYNQYSRKYKKRFIPMVVAVKVPDPALVIPDYDVDQASDQTWYNHSRDPQAFYSVNSEKASKHAGLFGYSGRIPSKFIVYLYLYSYDEKQWKRLTPDKFAKSVSGVDNYGQDFWYQRLGYPDMGGGGW